MIRLLLVGSIVAVLLAGCGGQKVDKAGGKGGDVTVLRLANGNHEPGELTAFAREVKRISDGRLRIQFVNDYRRGENDAEPGIIADVRAGKIDLAWVGARAFKPEGVTAFDPLIAPFEVTDYDIQQRVLADPVAREMLDAVQTLGVEGVALLPGPLRRLALRERWSGPDDLAGKRIGAPAGIGSDAFRALGAEPVVGGSASKLKGLDGAEEHLPSFLGNFHMHEIPHVASQPLWPRPLVVIASPAAWERLDAKDRDVLLEAGESAVLPTLNDIRAADQAAVPKLCRQGARFFEADVGALRAAVAPVIDGLRGDPGAARVLDVIDRARSTEPAPLVCDAPRSVKGGLPAGEYTFSFTEADRRSRPDGKDFGDELPETFRVVITPGHMVMWVSSRGRPEEVGLEEDFSVFRDRIDIGGGTITGRFEVEANGDLRFSDIEPRGGDSFVFEAKRWKRVR